MMKYLFRIFPLLTILFLIGCGGSEPQNQPDEISATTADGEINFDGMGIELCECMEPMMELQSKLMELLAQGDEEAIKSFEATAQKIQMDGEVCVQALEEKYGIVEGPEAEAKATEALRKACPEFMAMMEGAAPPNLDDVPLEELEEAVDQMEESDN